MTFVPLSPIPVKRSHLYDLPPVRSNRRTGRRFRADRQNRDPHAHSGGIGRLHYARTGNESFHAAVHLAATVGTLLVWVGEAGVRVYSSGQPGGARADKLLYQAKLALTEDLRLEGGAQNV